MSMGIYFVNNMKIKKIIHKDGSSRTEIFIYSRDFGRFELKLYCENELNIENEIIDYRKRYEEN